MIDAKTTAAIKAAKEAGDKTYTGKPCRYGHTGKRFVSNRSCVDCLTQVRLLVPYDKDEGRKAKARYRQRLKMKADAVKGADIFDDLFN